MGPRGAAVQTRFRAPAPISPLRGAEREACRAAASLPGLDELPRRSATAPPAPSSQAAPRARAAKMVIVDIDHPDIEDFIEWKVIEEQKVRRPGGRLQADGDATSRPSLKACVNCEGSGDDCCTPAKNPAPAPRDPSAAQEHDPRQLHRAGHQLRAPGLSRISTSRTYDTDWDSDAYTSVVGPELAAIRCASPTPSSRRCEEDGDWDLTHRGGGKVATHASRRANCGRGSPMPPGPVCRSRHPVPHQHQ